LKKENGVKDHPLIELRTMGVPRQEVISLFLILGFFFPWMEWTDCPANSDCEARDMRFEAKWSAAATH
jgi:hypothetical protein